MKWSGLGFVAGAVFLVAALSTSYLVAFAGFLVMLGCALYFERNLRKLGKPGLAQVSKSMRTAGLRAAFGGATGRLRERLRRNDHPSYPRSREAQDPRPPPDRTTAAPGGATLRSPDGPPPSQAP